MSKKLENLLISLLKIYFIYIPILWILFVFVAGFIDGFTSRLTGS